MQRSDYKDIQVKACNSRQADAKQLSACLPINTEHASADVIVLFIVLLKIPHLIYWRRQHRQLIIN